MRLNNLTQVGGVNSIENFARSWTRAAGFPEVTPHHPSFILSDQEAPRTVDEVLEYGRSDTGYGHVPRTSLLGQAIHGISPDNAIDDECPAPEDEHTPLTPKLTTAQRIGSEIGSIGGRGSVKGSIFNIAPHLATPLGGSYGTSYGTLHSTLNESSMIHAANLWRQQQAGAKKPDGEHLPLLVKEIEQDGKKMLVVEGQSTLPQTIFNATNVLIGVGLLSLPMGFKYSGWLPGMIFLLLSAGVTGYTAKLLAKCMDTDPSLITFADIAFVSFGQKARIATSVLFTLELLAACVALVVLFADTLDLLIPGFGVVPWKVFCGLLLVREYLLPLTWSNSELFISLFRAPTQIPPSFL